MKPCRILYLVGELGLGGLQRQLCFLLDRLDRERYQPAVVVWDYREDEPYVAQIRKLGVPLYFFPGKPSPLVKLASFRRLVQRLNPEVVHSFSFYTNFAAFWGSLGRPMTAVGSVRSNFESDKDGCGPLLGRLNARWPGSQVFNSFAGANNAKQAKGPFVPQRIFVARNALDLDRFGTAPILNSRPVCIAGVGSLLPVKRWDRLLDAAAELKRRGLEFVLRIAGIGPLREELQTHARKLALNGCVTFLGHTDDIPKLLAQANFLAHTSDTEGCPNAIMEAMACGRAVVATDAGEIPFLVDDSENGFVVRRGDQVTLVERLARLISDRNLCQRMGEKGRAKAEREFTLDRLVAETLNVYRNLGWRDARQI